MSKPWSSKQSKDHDDFVIRSKAYTETLYSTTMYKTKQMGLPPNDFRLFW